MKLQIAMVKTKQSSRYCSVDSVECVIHMSDDAVQLAFT